MTFNELKICPQILAALDKQGFQAASPIQEQAIPPILAGKDLLGCAQTGSGKTAAFAVPILQILSQKYGKKNAHQTIRSLILTPTRELAAQIQDSFQAFGERLPFRCGCILGGVSQKQQERMLANGVDILIATPGRLNDLIRQNIVDLSQVEILVLDEADRMLDMGFLNDVKKIISNIRRPKQTLLFSATMPKEISALIDTILHDYIKVAVDPVSSAVDAIDQKIYFVDSQNKKALLLKLLEENHVYAALVFTRTKRAADILARELRNADITAEAIHGNKSQATRQKTLQNFKNGVTQMLVATDLAARGIDIKGLEYVFNYNLPEEAEMYVHRIGRTGRAGANGTAISFCNFEEKTLLPNIEKLAGNNISFIEDHPYPLSDFTVKQRQQGRMKHAPAGKGRRKNFPAANKNTVKNRCG
ncbi:MAG: DEAD/DEAH box helicase [Clostridia bacterium]